MSAPKAPRCGKRIRNWKVCGRPAGHRGWHLSEEAYQREIDRLADRRAAGLEVILSHGYGGYSRGCRCEVCKDAKAKYMSAKRRAATQSAQPGEAVTGVTHGTRSAYKDKGCRCGKCVEYIREYYRERQAAA
jgi:hypothetical protein